MLGASLLLGCIALAPQGGLNRNLPPYLRPQLEYPPQPAAAAFSPFLDAQGTPVRFDAVSVGTGDFDGDRNPEAWFVAADGSISVQMPQTADLGRFLGYADYPSGSAKAMATFHSTTTPTDIGVILVPSSNMLDAMFYVPSLLHGHLGQENGPLAGPIELNPVSPDDQLAGTLEPCQRRQRRDLDRDCG